MYIMRREKRIRTTAILLRLSEEEKQELMELASLQKMSLSDYLRFVGLRAKVKIDVEVS